MDFKSFYDKTARIYDQRHDSPATRILRKKEVYMIRKYAKGRVLDIGCGTGYHMEHAGPGLDITGIDISEEMLKISRANGLNVKNGNAEEIPFPDSSFDTAFCFFTVLNMCDSAKAIKEMARALKPGGCALLSLSSVHDKTHFRISRHKVELQELFTKQSLIDVFGSNGMELAHFDSVFRSGRPRWGDYNRVPVRERINLWMDRFRPVEKGVVYLAAFRKMPCNARQ